MLLSSSAGLGLAKMVLFPSQFVYHFIVQWLKIILIKIKFLLIASTSVTTVILLFVCFVVDMLVVLSV